MIRLGCLGYGLWGRNVARVAASTVGARLVAIADPRADRREEIPARLPGVEVMADADALIARDDIDAVLIATDAATHAELAVAATAAGKHVFVEKPLALDPATAREAAAAAERAGRLLQVGHLMRYHPAVELLTEIARTELGEIRCVAAQRLNFGTVRADENVLFSLGPHDLSIMLQLFGARPESVAAQGGAFVREGVEDLCFVTLRFPGGRIGQMHLSWLDPHKVRRVTVVGERKMAVFDDMEPREKVRVYDMAVEPPDGGGFWVYGENLSLRTGDIKIPAFQGREPLGVELAHFVDCVAEQRPPRTGAEEGVAVVDVLAAAQDSMRNGGVPVRLS
ncbi:MAG: Gfo/Idh/MocA family protein [Planctomycetota bacterium]|jgi:predicted dehydrogenase